MNFSQEFYKKTMSEIRGFKHANDAMPDGIDRKKGKLRVNYLNSIMVNFAIAIEQGVNYQKKYIDSGIDQVKLLQEIIDLKEENKKLKAQLEWDTQTTPGEN